MITVFLGDRRTRIFRRRKLYRTRDKEARLGRDRIVLDFSAPAQFPLQNVLYNSYMDQMMSSEDTSLRRNEIYSNCRSSLIFSRLFTPMRANSSELNETAKIGRGDTKMKRCFENRRRETIRDTFDTRYSNMFSTNRRIRRLKAT